MWTPTRDTRLAAAMATLNVPVKPDVVEDVNRGQRNCTWYLGLQSASGAVNTVQLKGRFRSGKLEREEPDHPLLVGLRSLHNRESHIAMMKDGAKFRLVKAGTLSSYYQPGGDGLPGLDNRMKYLKTGDLKLVSALATVGGLVDWIEGSPGQENFFIRSGWQELQLPKLDVLEWARVWRESPDKVPGTSPFGYAMRVQYNRANLMRAAEEQAGMLLVRQSGGPRAAYMRPESTDKAWKQAEDFLG